MEFSSAFIMPASMPVPASALRYASALCSGTVAESGWRLSPEEDPPSTSLFPQPPDLRTAESGRKHPCIAVIEDNVADVDLLRYALKEIHFECDLEVLSDGERALRFLDEVEAGTSSCPDLFVIDLNLPKRPGTSVLQRIRQSVRCREVPVVVLSSSAAERDRQESSRLGANRYITKPSNLDDYLAIGQLLTHYLRPPN